MTAPTGSLVAYATAPGQVAADGDGRNGIYTKHLLDAMKVSGTSLEQVFKQVRIAVEQDTAGRQIPWEESSLTGDFYFVRQAPDPLPSPGPAPIGLTAEEYREQLVWQTIEDSDDPRDFEQFLQDFPNGNFAVYANRKRSDLVVAGLIINKPDDKAKQEGNSTSPSADELLIKEEEGNSTPLSPSELLSGEKQSKPTASKKSKSNDRRLADAKIVLSKAKSATGSRGGVHLTGYGSRRVKGRPTRSDTYYNRVAEEISDYFARNKLTITNEGVLLGASPALPARLRDGGNSVLFLIVVGSQTQFGVTLECFADGRSEWTEHLKLKGEKGISTAQYAMRDLLAKLHGSACLR